MIKKFRIYNTLEKKKVQFVPVDSSNIRVYACGPTVYNYAHIGNARMAVVCDLLVRVLRTIYNKVTYVSNITDIDDKIITESNRLSLTSKELSEKFLKIYNDDMGILGVEKPNVQPKATEYISYMIEAIEKLVKNENAYLAKNHVLFHVPSFENYGCLSRRDINQQIAGNRIDKAPYKKHPSDFVLWKPSKKNEPYWESPWGRGRPGWHIECSVMSAKCLGLPFDIHGGGVDLTFPHHENEIAQSCCISKGNFEPTNFARYWFHNGFVLSDGEKMSKSLGNIRLVNDLIKSHSGDTIRYSLLSSHYRQPLNWSENILDQSKINLNRFHRVLEESSDIKIESNFKNPYFNEFLEILYDDLNTAKAFGFLNKKVNKLKLKKLETKHLKDLIIKAGGVLGLFKNLNVNLTNDLNKLKKVDNQFIQELINERNTARLEKKYELADKIRIKINKLGVEIKDNKDGTIWKKN